MIKSLNKKLVKYKISIDLINKIKIIWIYIKNKENLLNICFIKIKKNYKKV